MQTPNEIEAHILTGDEVLGIVLAEGRIPRGLEQAATTFIYTIVSIMKDKNVFIIQTKNTKPREAPPVGSILQITNQ